MSDRISIRQLPPRNPDPSPVKNSHHIDSGPSGFKNPWPSFSSHASRSEIFQLRFGKHPDKNNVPVPEGPNGTRSTELVKVLTPKWGADAPDKLRATWLGHASFLIETPAAPGARRGIRILFDPVFSERTSPFNWIGPKRYTPTPCAIDELPDIDVICISHNHYDHLDINTVTPLYQKHKGKLHFLVGLNIKSWFVDHVGCASEEVTELDWWDRCEFDVKDLGTAQFTCTPAQHTSGRTIWDTGKTLWCSWALEAGGKKFWFAGDTAYQAQGTPSPCPAFQEIGETVGPFDLALLPIGLYSPPSFMGNVHVTPEQSFQIHLDVKSKHSIGMHYGTVRGGLSGAFEDVRDPPRRWRAIAEKASAWRGGGIEGDGKSVDFSDDGVGLCHVGETVTV